MPPRPSLSLSGTRTTLREAPHLVETSLVMRYLPLPALPISLLQRPTPAVEESAAVTMENFAKLAAAAGITNRSSQTNDLISGLDGPKCAATPGNKQSDLATLIQQEELKLMLERLKTRRLSEMLLHHSNTNTNGK